MKKNGKYTKKQMVIPGNLSSQLCVLDSSQQLYAPLFSASSLSSRQYSFTLELPEKKLLFLPFLALISPLSFSFLFFLFLCLLPQATLLPPLFTSQQAWLAQPLSLLLHAYCSRLSFSLIYAP